MKKPLGDEHSRGEVKALQPFSLFTPCSSFFKATHVYRISGSSHVTQGSRDLSEDCCSVKGWCSCATTLSRLPDKGANKQKLMLKHNNDKSETGGGGKLTFGFLSSRGSYLLYCFLCSKQPISSKAGATQVGTSQKFFFF